MEGAPCVSDMSQSIVSKPLGNIKIGYILICSYKLSFWRFFIMKGDKKSKKSMFKHGNKCGLERQRVFKVTHNWICKTDCGKGWINGCRPSCSWCNGIYVNFNRPEARRHVVAPQLFGVSTHYTAYKYTFKLTLTWFLQIWEIIKELKVH